MNLLSEKTLDIVCDSYEMDLVQVPSENGYKICVSYVNIENEYKPFAFLCNISSTNEITTGDIFEISQESASGNYIDLEFFNDNLIVAFPYQTNFNLVELEIQGDNLLIQKATKFTQNTTEVHLLTVGNNLILTTCFSTGGSKAFVVKFNEDGFQLENGYQFNGLNSSMNLGACAINEEYFVLAYENQGIRYGQCGVLQVYGNQVGENFINKSNEAIALQNGSQGETVEIIYTGTIVFDGINKGDTFNSDGVNGVGLLDGILWVSANNTPYTKINIGNYLGTGQFGESDPNMLTFNFSPKILFIAVASIKSFVIVPVT